MAANVNTVIGFDFGMKYIGVAVGQTITNTSSPIDCLRAKDGIPEWDKIDQLISYWTPQLILVGNPLHMDDTKQLVTHCAKKFANRLKERYKIPVQMVDERLSTWEAKINNPTSTLTQINAQAAAILVRQWLSSPK